MHTTSQQAWKRFWDGTGKSVDPLAAVDWPEVSQRTYRTACARIHDLLNLTRGDVFLNIGCGPGLFEEQMASIVKLSIGLDFSYVMVSKAQLRNRDIPHSHFLQATGTALPFARDRFDKVLCYSILHYLSEDEVCSLLHEIRQVTRPGALVLLGDVQDISELDSRASLSRAREIWDGAGLKTVIRKGTQRVKNEIRRRAVRLQRKWMVLAGRYVVETKPQRLTQYSRAQLLAMASSCGFQGQVIEQHAERFVGGRYHVLLRAH